ncbi:MAG: RidA family protein [Rhodospirillaceae bacterium]|jgi:2-iminobutanoate/2-iminopropanoate deaminase|nr:RidA family protein [Rhodospirillaceae bacterium]
MPVNHVIKAKKRPDGTSLPLSGAVQAGDFLFLSGQLAMNAERQIEGKSIEEQTAQTLANIDATLREAGRSKADVVKATVWLTSTDDFMGFNKAYAAYFGDTPPPARSTVCTALMEPTALIEIEMLAYVGD